MYILQISDLHISSKADIVAIKEKINKLLLILRELLPENSQVLCCLLGDFLDKGEDGAFQGASEVLEELKIGLSALESIDVEYEIVPGNHDLCQKSPSSPQKDLSAFNEFATKVLNRTISFSDRASIVESNHFGYRFLAISTVVSNEIACGFIDYGLLNQAVMHPGSIIIAHHGVVSSDVSDVSAIRDGYRLHQFLEDNHCAAFLHGHTHGFKRYTVGNNCQIIGAGPMLKNEGTHDISNQCNLITISGGFVKEIKVLTYQGDREKWDVSSVYMRPEDNNYIDTDAYILYSRVLKDVEENELVPNLRIQIQNSFSAFEKSITDNFASFKDDAITWQSSKANEHLELTHGQQMNTKDLSWQEFVVNLLRKNPTTKRAIIPLIEKEKAFHSSDDQYLVSFDVVQVGFASDACKTLYITVYLRALEVRYFLPINLYEVYLIAKTLKESFSSIEEINVCLFAYRAEAKRNYGCLKKADIDLLRESHLCSLIFEKKYDEITALLEQKSRMGDTVIDMSWLSRLKNAIYDCCREEGRKELLGQIEVVWTKLEELKASRAHCSDYSLTQKEENSYCDALDRLIELFCGLK